MNTIKRIGLAGAVAGTLVFGACSTTNDMLGRNQQTWTMKSEEATPAVQAKVQIATGDKGTNRDLKLEAKHLAPAEATFSGASTYVVWLKPDDGRPVNIGVLSPDKDDTAKLRNEHAVHLVRDHGHGREHGAADRPEQPRGRVGQDSRRDVSRHSPLATAIRKTAGEPARVPRR